MSKTGDKQKEDRGTEFYPSPERMHEIEEMFRKMELDTEEKRRGILSQGSVLQEDESTSECWVTSLSDSTEPYTPEE
ncbi:hypothetical protein JXM67_15490 [candidate division WOR-3 bacterium]|nr:hypothetical protein [candidate division WOR-3 bacterium]